MSYDTLLGLNTIPEASGEQNGVSSYGLVAPGLGIPFGLLAPVAIANRFFMGPNINGNTPLNFPSTYPYGEWAELRMTTNFTGSNFNGIYMRVQSLVANTSGITGMAVEVRGPSAGASMGSMQGASFEVDFKGTTAQTITSCYGLTGQIGGDTGSPAVVTAGAALRAKLQTEAGMTLSGVSGLEISNEAISSIGLLGAAIKVVSTSGGTGYAMLIDASGTALSESEGGGGSDMVTLIKFKDYEGNIKYVKYDVGDAALVVV